MSCLKVLDLLSRALAATVANKIAPCSTSETRANIPMHVAATVKVIEPVRKRRGHVKQACVPDYTELHVRKPDTVHTFKQGYRL